MPLAECLNLFKAVEKRPFLLHQNRPIAAQIWRTNGSLSTTGRCYGKPNNIHTRSSRVAAASASQDNCKFSPVPW